MLCWCARLVTTTDVDVRFDDPCILTPLSHSVSGRRPTIKRDFLVCCGWDTEMKAFTPCRTMQVPRISRGIFQKLSAIEQYPRSFATEVLNGDISR